MATVQAAQSTAPTTSRERTVPRQSGTVAGWVRRAREVARLRHRNQLLLPACSSAIAPPRVPIGYRAATMDFAGGAGVATRSMMTTAPGSGSTMCKRANGHVLDPPRRAERLDLQLEMAVDFFLRHSFLLQALHQVAVLNELEMLPGREEQHRDEQRPDPDSAQQLTLARFVDLADDRVVAHVFLDRVFEVGRAHASLSIARSLALRARGLLATSSSLASIGRLVRIRIAASAWASARKVCLTMRSSSE